MTKKKYINPNLRKVTLGQCQKRTLRHYEGQQAICKESALSGANCWGELHTPTVIRDIFAAMTADEFQDWITRLYPETATACT